MLGQILGLALPIVLSQGLQTVILLSDRFILSKKDPLLATAASTGGFTAVSLSLFFTHLLLFSTTLIGRRFGQGDTKACTVLFFQALLIASASSLGLLLLASMGGAYFSVLGHPENYRVLELGYFNLAILACIPVLFRTALESYLIACGEAKPVLYASLVAAMSNIPISYCCVLGPVAKLFPGATGAAFGSLVANSLSLAFLFQALRHSATVKVVRPCWHELRGGEDLPIFLKQGAYMGMEKFVNSFCFVCFVNIFVVYGPEASTAMAIVFSWDQIAFLPLMGLYGAMMSLYSRFLGQEDLDKAHRCLHLVLVLSFGLMASIACLFFFGAETLTEAFLRGENHVLDLRAVQGYAAFFFRSTVIYIFANSSIFLYKAALRSLGYSAWCFRLSLVVHIGLVGATYLTVHYTSAGPYQAWGIFLAMLFILGASFVSKYYHAFREAERRLLTVNQLVTEGI